MLEHLVSGSPIIGAGRSNKRKKEIGVVLGVSAAIGIAMFTNGEALALSPNVQLRLGDPITVTRADGSSSDTLNPGSVDDGTGTSVDKGYGHYQIPIDLTILDSAKYSIYIAGDTSLIGKNTGEAISTVSAALPLATFRNTNNVWGYRWTLTDRTATQNEIDNLLNASSILPMPATSTLGTSDSKLSNPDGGDGSFSTENDRNVTKKLTLEFAANVDGNKSSDNYSGNVTVSVVASPIEATLFDITYMQEMTHDICDATPTPEATKLGNDDGGVENWATSDSTHYASTLAEANAALSDTDDPNHAGRKLTTKVPQVTLNDTRDNKTYLVRKLADGNCWMSQNLELDFLGTGQSYAIAETSDATAADQADANYFGTTISSGFRLTDTDTDLHTTTVWTPEYVNQINATKHTNYKVYATIIGTRESADPKYGWKNDGSDGLRSYNTAASSSNWAYSTLVTAGDEGENATFFSSATGEAYQKTGNLYNWTAATLGSSAGLTSGNAVDSICPKGWKLPSNSGDDSFINLLQTYDSTQTWEGGDNITSFNKINSSPLDFFRAGEYFRSSGYINGLTTHGSWWESVAGSGIGARHLYSRPSYTYTAVVSNKGCGFTVRCVAR